MQYPGYYIVSAMSLQAKWMIITTAWQIHLTNFASFSVYGMSAARMLFPWEHGTGMFGMVSSVPVFPQVHTWAASINSAGLDGTNI